MLRTNVSAVGAVLLVVALSSPHIGAAPIATWNFDSANGTTTFPLAADVGTGSLTTTFPSGDAFFPGTFLGVKSGTNNGRSITFAISTVGLQNLSLSFFVDQNGNGAFNSDQVSYSSTAVTLFTDFGPPFDPAGTTLSFDFSSVTALNNNPNVEIRITFSGATGNGNDQNRLDNVTFSGSPLNSDGDDSGDDGGGVSPNANPPPVPEPTSLAVFGVVVSVGGLIAARRKGTKV